MITTVTRQWILLFLISFIHLLYLLESFNQFWQWYICIYYIIFVFLNIHFSLSYTHILTNTSTNCIKQKVPLIKQNFFSWKNNTVFEKNFITACILKLIITWNEIYYDTLPLPEDINDSLNYHYYETNKHKCNTTVVILNNFINLWLYVNHTTQDIYSSQ